MACPELASLVPSGGAVAAAHVLVWAIDQLPERDAMRVLFGVEPATTGVSLGKRRQAAAALLELKPESFRLRREGRLLDALARTLVVESTAREPAGRSPGAASLRYFCAGSTFLLELLPWKSPVLIGRGPQCHVIIGDDPLVSRHHAELQYIRESWMLNDWGRNGTFVDERRIHDATPLRHGDTIRIGRTVMSFFDAPFSLIAETHAEEPSHGRLQPSAVERAILEELCRPWLEGREGVLRPPSVREVAARLDLSPQTVDDRLRRLYHKAGMDRLEARVDRLELVHRALKDDVVRAVDADDGQT